MQTIHEVGWSGLIDGREFLRQSSKVLNDSEDLISGMYHRAKEDITRQSSRISRGFKNDFHNAERTVKHGVNHVKHALHNVDKSAKKDWNKLDTFTRDHIKRAKNAIISGVTSVENDVSAVKNWVSNGINDVESGALQVIVLGLVLIYFFKDDIRTGTSYLSKQVASTSKNFVTQALPAAPLLLL